GIDASLVLAREQEDPDWAFRGLGDVPVLSLAEARAQRWDVAVATWWETCAALFELDARSRAYFVQSLEDRFYRPDDPLRVGATASTAPTMSWGRSRPARWPACTPPPMWCSSSRGSRACSGRRWRACTAGRRASSPRSPATRSTSSTGATAWSSSGTTRAGPP